jgi:uncharacterized protein (DUF58 family)
MPPVPLAGGLSARRKAIVLAALAAVAYLAAINRGMAFPWAMAALLSATLIAGFFWPRWLVRRLSVIRHGPTRAEEGETVNFRVEVENRGWLPRFMVELVDRLPFVGLADPDSRSPDVILGVLAYLPGRRTTRFEVPVVCEKRGFYRLGPVGLASSFPLGLAEARLTRNEGVQTLTVYPDVFNILGLPLKGAPSQIHRGGYLLPEGAGAAEFSGLREYRRGDNPRHIHWPTTARVNELMIREFEPLASACLCVALDRRAVSNLGAGRRSTFEYAVRIAASVARFACLNGLRTRFAAEAVPTRLAAGGFGDAHYQDILDHLAVVDSTGYQPYADVLAELATTCARGETVVVFLSEGEAETAATLQSLAQLRVRQAHIFAVVFDQKSFRTKEQAAGRRVELARVLAGLQEMGAETVTVRNGDDLVRRFNP